MPRDVPAVRSDRHGCSFCCATFALRPLCIWKGSSWLRFLLAGFVLFSLASCTAHAGSDLGGWVPIWSDEFNYSGKPDPSKWTVLDKPHTPAYNAFVDGSALILRVDKNGKGANMGTGNTSSIRYQGDYGAKYLFTPGRLDIRASAVLLPGIMNIAWGSTDWERWEGDTWISGEIDLFEIMGNEPDR
ncbi:MAG: glycoside hydrolase family 16, candidate beta-glycosidase, partial [Geminicoccaceae bacterium]|nr:glycoside hydrolase family 16, candidate beta-glycosidase [Geminicoccaceae bacterium]